MIKLRGKPIVDNVPAAEALTKLARATHTQGYLADAETVLGVFVPVYQEQGEGATGYALAVQRFLYPPGGDERGGQAGCRRHDVAAFCCGNRRQPA